MKGKARKEWRQPKLIIIGQGRPEENVLAGCKSHANPGGSLPTVSQSNCNRDSGNCGACQPNSNNAS